MIGVVQSITDSPVLTIPLRKHLQQHFVATTVADPSQTGQGVSASQASSAKSDIKTGRANSGLAAKVKDYSRNLRDRNFCLIFFLRFKFLAFVINFFLNF